MVRLEEQWKLTLPNGLENGTKPVVGFIAGQTAPKGRTMGHAGAIVGGADDTAEAKMKIMSECGIHVVSSCRFRIKDERSIGLNLLNIPFLNLYFIENRLNSNI